MESEITLQITGGKIRQEKAVVLDDVNFSIHKGEFVYLIGRTGSGKSSLLKTLYGELPLRDGDGSVGAVNLRRLKRRHIPRLRRQIGIVFQDFQLLTDRNVYRNLSFVLRATGWRGKKKIDARIREVLASVGLNGKENAMPHKLSGGEQQRVAIARALLNHPSLILADEPTGNLDPDTSAEIMRLLFDISAQGTSILMATHDMLLMEKFSARTVKCENGKVVDLKPASAFNPFKAAPVNRLVTPGEESGEATPDPDDTDQPAAQP
jgi:cell division transport system ATP-binding protein